jgi:hypothetical protein
VQDTLSRGVAFYVKPDIEMILCFRILTLSPEENCHQTANPFLVSRAAEEVGFITGEEEVLDELDRNRCSCLYCSLLVRFGVSMPYTSFNK